LTISAIGASCHGTGQESEMSDVKGMTVALHAADKHTLAAYRVGPEYAERGLVVVQEIFGVNHHIRTVCDRFAAQGYAVVAPALFDRAQRDVELGYGPDGLKAGLALRAQVPEAGTIADIGAAAEALPTLCGIVGYCWGGTVAWWGATRTTLFRAAVGWYGGGIAASRDATPHCPVQLHFGETDHSIPLDDVRAIQAAQLGVEIFTYPGAGHGFGCDERATYDAEASRLAEERTLAFFEQHLR
jgi:carboxymethylenebutenolidase